MARFKLNPKVLVWVGYVAYFFACFAIFAYLTFPYDRLQEFAKQQVAANTGGKGGKAPMSLEIGSIAPYWPPGLTLHDVSIERPPEADESPLAVRLDSATARLRVLPLLLGRRSLGFSAEQGAGSLSGSVSAGTTRTEIELELDAMDAEALGLGGLLKVPVAGQLSGLVDLMLSSIPTETDGDVQLTLANLQLGDGKAKVPVPGMRDGITVERINAGTLELELELRQGVVEVKKLSTSGPDLKLAGSGNLKLAEDLGRSRLDVTLELTFSDAYKARDDRTKALFQLMSFQPELKSAATSDGGLRFRVTGSLTAPRAKPQGGARPGPTAKRKKTK